MAVLIAGGAGYIGSHTAIELMRRGIDVWIADNFSGSRRDVIPRMERITGAPVVWDEVDFTDYRQTASLFASGSVEAVINFAARKSVAASIADPLSYYENNVNVMLNLCRAMEEYQVTKMVFSSSATVYGSGPSPMKETQALRETENPYGETKRICERILTDFQAARPSAQVCILRYFNPAGAHESGFIGEPMGKEATNLMPLLCRAARGDLEMISVYGSDYPTADGTGVRDYVHVMDVAEGHAAALDFLNENPGVHIFNLGGGRGVSVLELIETFQQVNGVRIPYRFAPRRPGDVAECFASVEKAGAILNWRPRRDLRDMVRDAWRFAQISNHQDLKKT